MNTKQIECLKEFEKLFLQNKNIEMFIVIDDGHAVKFATSGNTNNLAACMASAIHDNPALLDVFKRAIYAYEAKERSDKTPNT
jgi:hypothetical protein